MENDNEQNEIKEDSNLFFPLEDPNMLEKLRNCSVIPKEFSEFQIFVQTLTGNTIPDDIIKEAWRHIYQNEAPEEHNSNLSTTVRSCASNDKMSRNRNDINDVLSYNSKLCQSSRENLKKKYSSQCISPSQHNRMKKKKKKIVETLDSHVQMGTDSSSVQNGQNHPNTVQNYVPNTAIDCQSFDSISKGVKKSRCSSSSVFRTTEKINTSISENEIDDYPNKSAEDISAITLNSNKTIYNKTLQDEYDSNISATQQVELISKENITKIPLSSPVTISSNQMLESYSKNKSDDVTSDEDEDFSSDCEIIKIVSLNNSNNNASDDSENELTSVVKNEESDSDSSIEILESESNIKPITKNNEDTSCPIHGKKGYEVSPNSFGSFSNRNKSNSVDLQIPINPQACSNSNYDDINQKVEKKKRKNNKFKLLKTEVKCLKSLLVNLLNSVTNTSVTNTCKSSDGIPSVTTDLLDSVKENCGKDKKSVGSAFKGRKKMTEENETKASSSPNLKLPRFMEKDWSRKKYKPRERKKPNLKNTKTCNVPEFLQKVDDTDSSTSDNGRREKFVWREIITDTLKSTPGRQMSVEKLKRIVIAKYYVYRGNVSQNTTVKFFRYLHSTAGVVVNGNMAAYTNTEFKLSSTSEQINRFVLKTVTTTKEYEMS